MKTDPKWIRSKTDEVAIKQGCYFSPKAAKFAVDFIETFCCLTKGKTRELTLVPWQRDFIERLFGWKQKDGLRRFKTAYIEIPKKNGKSQLMAYVALLMAVADGEMSAEVYLLACNSKQAKIIFQECVKVLRLMPTFKRMIDLNKIEYNKTAKSITFNSTFSRIECGTLDADAQDGLDASATIFDELHRQKNDKLWRTFEHAGKARREPLLLAITTAGTDRQSVCWQEHERALKVIRGESSDTTHLAVIYAADRDDDINDPAVWRKANPSVGYILKEDDFRVDLEKIKDNPSQLNNFLRLRLNIWTDAEIAFISYENWDKCGKVPIDLKALEGQQCYCGLDLSSKLDITAFVMLFPQADGGAIVVPKFWLPEAQAKIREKTDGIPYTQWHNSKLIRLTPGAGIDPDLIEAEIKGLAQQYKIRSITCDDWGASDAVAKRLRSAGIKINYLKQDFRYLSEPTKELEKLAIQGKISHGNQAVLSWMNANALVKYNTNNDIKLVKPHPASPKKIDGLVALVEAMDGWLRVKNTSNYYSTLAAKSDRK